MASNRRQFMAASAMGVLGMLGDRFSAAQQSVSPIAFRKKVDSIDWYYELQGQGSTVVLIPSGEGDCGSFQKVAELLASKFKVLTFDMPGFSRSSAPTNFDRYTWNQAADEIAALVQALNLAPATFYGCSSGGSFALLLAVKHAENVRNVVVHEVALPPPVSAVQPQGPPQDISSNPILRLLSLTDEEVVPACKDLFRNVLNENSAAWDALGEAYHKRLERNYVTWVHHYLRLGSPPLTIEQLRGRPITWTVGGLSATAGNLGNIQAALAAGIPIKLLNSRHFPQVSIPEALAEHIANAAGA